MAQPTETTHTFTPPSRTTVFGLRVSALIEIAAALALLALIDVFFGDGTRFWDVNPHPFWFVVLLAAGKYGTKEGLVAAVAGSAVLLFNNIPEQSIDQDMYAYLLSILWLPLLWLVSAVLFGELRQMHIRERDRLEESLRASEEREHSITQSYQWVKQLKDRLEQRVAGQLRSSIAAYHAARAMETLTPAEVMQGLKDLVQTTLHPEQFSVHMLDKDGLSVTLTQGWRDGDSYQRHFGAGSALYEAVIGRQQVLCVANADHERLLARQGMLAGPLFDRHSGEVVGMLKIEKLGFTDLHLSNIETFSTVCEWAGMAIANARKYQTAKDSSMVNPDHNLLTVGYFKRHADYIRTLAERVGFDVSMLNIRMENAERLDGGTRARIARELAASVDDVLRGIDLAFDHQERSEEYSIVLPATNRAGAQIVLEKIRTALASRTAAISKQADFSFSAQTVYEQRK